MRTRSSFEYTIPRRSNRRRSRQQQEAIPLILDPIRMADDRPMAEQLQAQNFELKSSLINLIQNRIFRGGNDEEPHAHIRHFDSITNNQRYPDVPNTTIKLLLFPFSLDGVAKTWLDKEPPNSIPYYGNDIVSNTNAPPSSSTSSSSNFEFQQMAAALEDKMTLTFRNEMNEMKNMMKASCCQLLPIKRWRNNAPKVLDFTESGDSTSIISDPPSFTPFEGSEMILEEEIEEFLKHDESLNMDLNDEFNDEEGDITYLEKLLKV
ncbi:hypothetical protein Tco_1227808 [Tanacetum coccineum]